MSKPENSFIAGIHRHLPPEDDLHREKMSNPYNSGTADVWYSGKCTDLWVEYKFLTLPKRDSTVIDLTAGKSPMLSVLQQNWLRRRYLEGRNVWVIVGCAEGGVIMTARTWVQPWTTEEFKAHMLGRKEIAAWLLGHLEGS